MQNRIDSKIKEPSKICLVESPEIAYYFDGNKVTFSSIIPNGGTLLSQKNKIIAMNVSHYL